VGFHPADPGSNPGTSTLQILWAAVMLFQCLTKMGSRRRNPSKLAGRVLSAS
jgi:hypothetical protein